MFSLMTNTNKTETQTENIYGDVAPAKGFRRAGLFWYTVTLVETVACCAWKAITKR